MIYNQLKKESNKENNNSNYLEKVLYLKNYFWIVQELLDELVRNTEDSIIQASKMSGMPTSKIISTLDNVVLQKQIKNEKMESKIIELFSKKNEIEKLISKLDNPQEKYVLKCKYILFKTFEEISLNLNKSDRQIKRWHSSAINNLEVPNSTTKHC